MNLIKVMLCSFVIFSMQKSFSRANDKYKIISVRNIKELHTDGDVPYLKTYPGADVGEFTEERRLQLCREGFKQIRKNKFWPFKGKDEFTRETSPDTFKLYVVINSQIDEATILPAYKCPTQPATYINVSFNDGHKSQPIFQVIYRVSRPRPDIDLIIYELVLVEDIVQVNAAKFNGMMQFPQDLPDFDLDAFSEEQRRQICEKAKQTVPVLDIKLLEDAKISSNKFYTVTSMMYPVERIREALECPTEPKLYVMVKKEETKNVMKLWTLMKANDDYQETTLKTSKKLKAISEKKIAEPLYLQFRKANGSKNKIRIVDPRTQHALCQTIFKDSILHKYIDITDGRDDYLDHIDNMRLRDAQNTLKYQNPNLYKRLYKSSDSILISGEDVIVVGGTESIDISVSGTQEKIQEDVYVCLIRPSINYRNIREYYISKEYNVKSTQDSSGDHVTGRFVFKKNLDSNKLEIVAMVEECSQVSKSENVESLYLERRKNHEPVKSDIDDPLCRLSSSQRSRLCSIIFDYNILTKRTESLQNLGCAKNLITFDTKAGKDEAKSDSYYEYMIPCYITVTRSGDPRVHYLSRAYNSDEVFAYSRFPMNARIYLEGLHTDVRIGSFFQEKCVTV